MSLYSKYMKIRYIIYGALALGVAALVVYRINSNASVQQKGGPGKQGPITVAGVVLQHQQFNDALSLSGTIEADEQIEIRSEVSGIVESINFTEGSKVSAGQLLIKVNDLELRAQLSKTQTAKNLASENERRAKLLLEKEAISREEYDMASADFRQAQAETQLIQAQLNKTSVRAPFSGTVGLRNVSKGTYLTPETVVASLVNTGQVKITFSIPEKYAHQVKVGRQFTFVVAGGKEDFTAKVYAIEPQVDVATRTLRVRAVAQNKEGKLIPGTFANVKLPLETINDALLVPTEALIPIQNGKKVFISQGGKATEKVIETGVRTERHSLVLSGLKAGDTVLTTGVMSLKNGAPVKVKVN